jgi:hypothetical protein
MDGLIFLIAGIPIYGFVFWRAYIAWLTYEKAVKNPDRADASGLISTGTAYTGFALVILILPRTKETYLLVVAIIMFLLGVWNLYWSHRIKELQREAQDGEQKEG